MEICGRARRPPHRRHARSTRRTAPRRGSRSTISMSRPAATSPDPEPQPEIRPQARLPGRDARLGRTTKAQPSAPAILVGDLNVAPLENDVWSHKQLLDVVSHTPVETEALETLRGEAGWVDAMRASDARAREDLLPGGATARTTGPPPTRAAGSTTSGSRPTSPARSARSTRRGDAGLDAPVRPCPGHGRDGGLRRVR